MDEYRISNVTSWVKLEYHIKQDRRKIKYDYVHDEVNTSNGGK